MADSTTELKQLLLRYINEYKVIDRLREVLQTTSVEDRYEALMSVRGDYQYTAVYIGAVANNMDTIKYMMAGFTSDQQYNVLSVVDDINRTALHNTAYFNSDTAMVMYLLSNLSVQQRYNLLRMQNHAGDTALHDAATKKHNSVLQVMLSSVTTDQQKLLLNIKNNKNKTIADITSLPELAYDAAAWTRLDLDNTNVKLKNTKEELNNTKEMLDRAKEELTELKESHKSAVARQDAELSSTKEKLDSTKDELSALRECHESTVARQDAAVIQMISDVGEQHRRLVERETNQRVEELSALRDTHEALVAGQDAELQQLRYNQTEMLRMIEALEISLGRPTSDQENEC